MCFTDICYWLLQKFSGHLRLKIISGTYKKPVNGLNGAAAIHQEKYIGGIDGVTIHVYESKSCLDWSQSVKLHVHVFWFGVI